MISDINNAIRNLRAASKRGDRNEITEAEMVVQSVCGTVIEIGEADAATLRAARRGLRLIGVA